MTISTSQSTSHFPPGAPVPPGMHPRIACTREELVWMREAAATARLAKQGIDNFVNFAEKALTKTLPPAPPPKGDDSHLELAVDAVGLGYAGLLTDDARYLHKAREIVLYFADILLTYPYEYESYLYLHSLVEGWWLGIITEAVDLLFAADMLSPQEKQHVIDDMLIACAEGVMRDMREHDGHHMCYNFQALHFQGVGRVGFLLGNQRYIDWALGDERRVEPAPDGRGVIRWGFGLRHMIAHDLRDDGIFWERSIGYHFYTVLGLFQLAQTALRNGVNVWKWQVPDDTNPDDCYCGNYQVDGDNGPKTLGQWLEGPLHYVFPDMTFTGLGDCEQGELYSRAHLYEVGYTWTRDPRFAWFLQQAATREGGREAVLQPSAGRAMGVYPWDMVMELPAGTPPAMDGAFCTTGYIRSGSRLFPSTGVALLNHPAPTSSSYARETLSAMLTYGPYGGGHGHPGQLSFTLHQGERRLVIELPIPDGKGYGSPYHATWTNHTVSHNTIVVDGKTQYPADTSPQWGHDGASDPSTGTLIAFHADKLTQLTRVTCDRVYPGVHLDRTLCCIDGVLIDLYLAASETTHTYDWLIHVPGKVQPSCALVPRPAIGADSGYEHLENVRGVTLTETDTPFQCLFSTPDGGVRVILPAIAGTEAMIFDGPNRIDDHPVPGLLLRRTAQRTTFAAVFQPDNDERPVTLCYEAEGRLGVAIGHKRYLLAVNLKDNKPLALAGLSLPARVAVVRLDHDDCPTEGSVAGLIAPSASLPSLDTYPCDGHFQLAGGEYYWEQTWETVRWR